MTIYFITNTYFNNRDQERFGINYYLNKNYKVVVIDVQDYTNPELISSNKPKYQKDKNLNVISCNSFNCFKETINRYGDGVAILFISGHKGIKISKYLQKNGIKIGIMHLGMLPNLEIKKRDKLVLRIINKVKKINIKNLYNYIFDKYILKIINIKNYDFLITSNYDTSINTYNLPKINNIIEAHALDYDIYLNIKNDKSYIDYKYAVFIDQDLFEHSDWDRVGKRLNVNKQNYFKELNNFFDYIEENYKLKVIIASHPRADKEKYKDLYNNRDIISNQTALLVKDSQFIITHFSTASNFAILYNKPILFLTSNELEHSCLGHYIINYSKELNQDYINISANNYKIECEIDRDKYNSYKKKYIKNNNKEQYSYEIFNNEYLKRF